jgi:uncharacterized peroxidase-related enzyme
MSLFPPHTRESAPRRARDLLVGIDKARGMIPNLMRVMAESPTTLKAYLTLSEILTHGDFTPAEQQLLLLTVSRENGCAYCVAAHTLGGKTAKLDDQAIDAVRDGLPIADGKLQALRRFAETVVRNRGHVGDDDIRALLAQGYTKGHVLEVLLAASLKTISNYLDHFAEPPLDEALTPARWEQRRAAE